MAKWSWRGAGRSPRGQKFSNPRGRSSAGCLTIRFLKASPGPPAAHCARFTGFWRSSRTIVWRSRNWDKVMVIYMPVQASEDTPVLDELTPREIVRELDKYVIGQGDAKKAVAIALRNRIRRQKLEAEMADEVMPKNILMIGPTGVGKTELARRLAKLANSPFLKVEASKFTEVGYVGRGLESSIRDLVEISIDM